MIHILSQRINKSALGREERTMSIEENKAIVRRLFEELNKGNIDILDEIFAPDFINHHPAPSTTPDKEGVKQFIANMHNTFPDYRWDVEDLIAEGDKVVYRFTMQGTDKGGLMGMPPTGKKVVAEAIGIQRFVNGKAVERWNIGDSLGMLQKLGIIPSMG
jgi:steroid delta-isomerase-like uncharacterized protein